MRLRPVAAGSESQPYRWRDPRRRVRGRLGEPALLVDRPSFAKASEGKSDRSDSPLDFSTIDLLSRHKARRHKAGAARVGQAGSAKFRWHTGFSYPSSGSAAVSVSRSGSSRSGMRLRPVAAGSESQPYLWIGPPSPRLRRVNRIGRIRPSTSRPSTSSPGIKPVATRLELAAPAHRMRFSVSVSVFGFRFRFRFRYRDRDRDRSATAQKPLTRRCYPAHPVHPC
jgi:hypothetical protein